MVAGLIIGFAMGRSRFMTSYFSLPLFVLGNMPGLTYAVFGLLIFGVGAGGPIVVSALVATPFIAMNVAEGVRSVGRQPAGDVQRVRTPAVRHPAPPLPTRIDNFRIRRRALRGFAMAWKVEALTEVFGASSGSRIHDPQGLTRSSRCDDMLAWTALFIIAMVLIERGLAHLENRFFAWRKEIA